MKRGILLLALIICIPFALGATIYGRVFDYNFRLAQNSIVNINTVPEQIIVAVDGSYSFNVPNGNFVLTAYLKDQTNTTTYFVQDNISVVADGDYVHDLIMFPNEDLNDLNLDDTPIDEFNGGSKTQIKSIVIIITAFVLVIIFALLFCFAFKECKLVKKREAREKPSEVEQEVEADDLAGLVSFIRKNKRVTQKDIRKNFPLSEAKISLMITDLESQGKIRKIKKGRGNIIVWDEK